MYNPIIRQVGENVVECHNLAMEKALMGSPIEVLGKHRQNSSQGKVMGNDDLLQRDFEAFFPISYTVMNMRANISAKPFENISTGTVTQTDTVMCNVLRPK